MMADWADEQAERIRLEMRMHRFGVADFYQRILPAELRQARAKGIEEAAAQLLDKAAIYRQLDGHMSLVRHFKNEAEAIRALKDNG